jgi:hypothetical protein
MGRIKSALEIALERTESVKSDKDSIGQFGARQNGKKLANQYLGGELKSLEDAIKKAAAEERASIRQGIFDVLVAQLALPVTGDDQTRIEAAGRGLQAVIGGSRFAGLIKQFGELLGQYLTEAAQYEEAIKQQYAPKLKQKEEELSRRMGQQVRLDPFQDPEFVAFYNQNMNQLKANYQAAVDQVREEAAAAFKA